MTTEILRNMLFESFGSATGKGWLVDVDAIVLDEVHYLSDISRGTVWEEIIIYCPKDVQLISFEMKLILMFDHFSVKFSESCGVRDWVIKMEDLRSWLLKVAGQAWRRARLLRQTLNLVSQIPHLPHIDGGLGKNARPAREAMNRSPISEL